VVMKGIEQIAKEAERRFNLPPLSKVTESLDKFPDAKQLKLIKEVLETAERVSKTAPELDKVVALIREVNALPTDKLKDMEKVLRRIEKIMKTAPEGILEFISSLSDEGKPKNGE